ncbi:MAG TPA: GAF domain-containing protein [Caulobacterales bacterium]|nr:GAF domain-containing protein [Caulobacterales bacterium]
MLISAQTARPIDLLMDVMERVARAETELGVAAAVRSAARQMVGADGATVVFRRGERVAYVDEDAIGPLWKGQDFPIEACISGWAILNKQTVAIENIYDDPRIPSVAYKPTFVNSLAMAPVRPEDPIAAIGAYWAEPHRPTAEEVHALETIARATAIGLENVERLALIRNAA